MPSPLEKLQKFLKLEIENGYQNRAIIGGLDKILPWWERDARSSNVDSELIGWICEQLRLYSNVSPEERPTLAQELIKRINVAQFPGKPIQELATRTLNRMTEHTESQSPGLSQPLPVQKPIQEAQKVEAPKPLTAATPENPHPNPIALNTPVIQAPNVGKANQKLLEGINVETIGDLLYHFPKRYIDYSQLKPINRIKHGEILTVLGTVQTSSTRPIKNGKLKITEAIVSDGTESLRLNWFNKPWLVQTKLRPGTQLSISGKVDMYLGRFVMKEPEIEEIDQEHLHTNRIAPIYPLTAGLTQKTLRRIIKDSLQLYAARVPEPMPRELRIAAGVINLQLALQQVHFPDTKEQLKMAQDRLAFDEIFMLQLGVLRQKSSWQIVDAQKFEVDTSWLQKMLELLPYELTGAQQKVLSEIRKDLASGHPMNRLIQGDVGSGKTVVAALTTAMITTNGAQAAIMAPTSILAEQHFKTFQTLLAGGAEQQPLRPEEIELLVGDTSSAEKDRIRAGLSDGTIKVVIGTHALIEDPIQFQRLQFAVIDEQHRFGVEQRSKLRSKGDNPHLLVMTATPIPRSLALTLYGDLDLSVMDEMPKGRIAVSTHVLTTLERERAYNLINKQVASGKQAFIVYPLVEEGEETNGQAAVEEHQRLQKKVFPNLRLGLLHGRLRPSEKEQAMSNFRKGEYDILVSTTVIEVGMDVPNATVMLIEGANRFGLAQLHQLRGRVGRGKDPSYCLLIPDGENGQENARLAVMTETNDGFLLAERDLEQRGPGDFLGTRQAGFADLRMASLTDVRLIEKARNLAEQLFEQDPELSSPAYQLLAERLNSFWYTAKSDIS